MSDKLLIVLEQKWKTCGPRMVGKKHINLFTKKKLKLNQFSTTGEPHFFLINISFWKKTRKFETVSK